MSTSPIGDGSPEAESPRVKAVTPDRRGINVRVLMVVIVCAGAIAWAGRTAWESFHPVVRAARGLRSSDPSQRAAAVRELSELSVTGSGEAIRAVLPVLADPDATARAAGAEALSVVGSFAVKSTSPANSEATRAAVTALTGLLKDQEPAVRCMAAGALGTIAGAAAGSNSGRGQGRAGKMAKSAAPPPSSIDSTAVVTSLLDLLSDPDSAVREAALSGLRDCAPNAVSEPPQRLFAAVDDQSAINRAIAVGVLSRFSKGLDPVVPVLLRRLETDDPSVHDACVQALARIRPSGISPKLIPTLIAGLGTPDRDARRYLIGLLARMSPDPRATVPPLIKVLREPVGSDVTVTTGLPPTVTYVGPAQEAANALGRIAPATPVAGDAIAALVETVRSGPRERRGAAADALSKFGKAAAGAVPGLVAFLRESIPSKVATFDGSSAAEALSQLAPGTPSASAAVAALMEALEAESSATRQGALEALRSFKPASPEIIATIRTIHEKDSVPGVRKAAAATLEEIQGPSR